MTHAASVMNPSIPEIGVTMLHETVAPWRFDRAGSGRHTVQLRFVHSPAAFITLPAAFIPFSF
jgi:hypothetical protein